MNNQTTILEPAFNFYKNNQFLEAISFLKQLDIERLYLPEEVNQYYYCQAACCEKLAKYNDAVVYAEKSLEIKNIDNEYYVSALGLLGVIYKKINKYDIALDYYQKAVKLTTDDVVKAQMYVNIANCYTELEEYDNSLIYFQKALNQSKASTAIIKLNMSITYIYMQNMEAAEQYIQDASKDVKNEFEQKHILQTYAGILFNKKYYEQSIKYNLKALNIAKKLNLKKDEMVCNRNIGLAFVHLNNYSSALNYYKDAIEIFEKIGHENINDEDNKMPFYIHHGDLYQSIVKICYKLKKYEEAFLYSQRSKAKSFRDLHKEIYLPILSVEQIQNILKLQNKQISIIDYFLDIDNLYIFTIDENNFYSDIVELDEKILEQYYEYYKQEIISAENRENKDIGEMWLEITKFLIEPVLEHITHSDTLIFVTNGIINRLPLHTLTINNQRVIEKYATGYLPTISLLLFWKNKYEYDSSSNVIFGVDFENEAVNIHKIIQGELFLGNEVSRQKAIESIKQKNIVYFSCHGNYDKHNPESSGLLLGNSEILTVKDIKDLIINSNTIILSACESGLGTINNSNEIIGLAQAFLSTGVRTIIVSLWKIDSAATEKFMETFIHYLKHWDKITALQKTIVEFMQNENYQHPYFYAPFILIGNPD